MYVVKFPYEYKKKVFPVDEEKLPKYSVTRVTVYRLRVEAFIKGFKMLRSPLSSVVNVDKNPGLHYSSSYNDGLHIFLTF